MAVAITYADELQMLKAGFGLTDRELAAALDTTGRTLTRWAGARVVPRPQARARIEDLLDVLWRLRRSVREDAIAKWIRRRVDLLGGERPADLLVRGELDRLRSLVDGFAEGVFV